MYDELENAADASGSAAEEAAFCNDDESESEIIKREEQELLELMNLGVKTCFQEKLSIL